MIWFILLIMFIICLVLFIYFNNHNNAFYKVNDIQPKLNNIYPLRKKIISEVNNIQIWVSWPEKNLYETPTKTWNIFPFYAFGLWINKNCEKCPTIYNFLKSIPNLKLATLSRLSAGMKLKPHYGWGNHSNYVLRCHYGIKVPKNCYVVCDNKKKYHKNNEWIIFDDSKSHYACNESDQDRIVLIIDIERPKWIKKGESKVGDTKELLEIIEYYKSLNN